MALWLNRSGRHCEHESRLIEAKRIFLTWAGLDHDLSKLADRESLMALLEKAYLRSSRSLGVQNSGQIWAFVHRMAVGDWVAVPSKRKTIYIGEITGDYAYEPAADDPYDHYRPVKWLELDVPRTNFDQDIPNSLVCEITRNDYGRSYRVFPSEPRIAIW